MADVLEERGGINAGTARGVADSVREVHEQHMCTHPVVQEYESAGAYFEATLTDTSKSNETVEVAETCYELPPHAAFRIHSHAPRDFMVIQTNPNLRKNWVNQPIHQSYDLLGGAVTASVGANIRQSLIGTASFYFPENKPRRNLKHILAAMNEVFDIEVADDILTNADSYAEYMQLSAATDWLDTNGTPGFSLSDGFYGDFAYSNVCKLQARNGSIRGTDCNDEWLLDEMAAIAPRAVLALGGEAHKTLKRNDFEPTGAQSVYADGDDVGRVLRYNGPRPDLQGVVALQLRHLGYFGDTDQHVYDAVRLLRDELA